MKVIVDVGVGKAVERTLVSCGHDVLAVRNIDPALPDREILAIAHSDARLIVTMDKDFGELVYRSGLAHAGVLLLRLDDAAGDEKAIVVERIFEKHAKRLARHFSVYQGGRLRIR